MMWVLLVSFMSNESPPRKEAHIVSTQKAFTLDWRVDFVSKDVFGEHFSGRK